VGEINFESLLDKARDGLPEEARKRAEELMPSLGEIFFIYKNTCHYENRIVLSEGILAQACISFWEDILRVKAYHTVHYADGHKKAAYIFKWITKLRPVKPLVDYSKVLFDAEIEANSKYALYCALAFLKIKMPYINESELKYIIYSANYREIHPEEWSMIFYLLEKFYMKG
jgi:hypothetical protein